MLGMRQWPPVNEAQKAGHVDPKMDPTRLLFEVHAMAMGAHWAYQLLDDRQAYSRARRYWKNCAAWRQLIRRACRRPLRASVLQRLQAKGCGVLLDQSLNKCRVKHPSRCSHRSRFSKAHERVHDQRRHEVTSSREDLSLFVSLLRTYGRIVSYARLDG